MRYSFAYLAVEPIHQRKLESMTSGLPILVVEDDPNLREAVCDTLELAGQAVVSAPGGEEALSLLDEQAVALVVSDVRMMPWMASSYKRKYAAVYRKDRWC